MDPRNSTDLHGKGNDFLYIEKNYGILIGILASLTAVGVHANAVVVFIFYRLYKRSSNTFNVIMISTSLGDLMLIAVAGPTRVLSYLKGVAKLGNLECKIYGCWVHLTSVASLGHLVLLAAERYWVIKYEKKQDDRPIWKKILLVFLPWLYATLWTILPLLGWSEYAPESQHVGCAPKWISTDPLDVSYNATIMISEFFLPLAIIITIYIKIFGLIKDHMERTGSEAAREIRVQRNVMMLTMLMVATFVFCWLPYTVCCLWAISTSRNLLPSGFGALPSIFAKSSVLWNPILYGAKHHKFRREFCRVYRQLRGRSVANIDLETTAVKRTIEMQ
uniref:C-like opsin n=1 Tax=Tripedalia cystophora TaxID=6141 RepID=A0A059NTG9_TRICY|nr:c-like opsin [Tripedalia cystophora]